MPHASTEKDRDPSSCREQQSASLHTAVDVPLTSEKRSGSASTVPGLLTLTTAESVPLLAHRGAHNDRPRKKGFKIKRGVWHTACSE